MSNNRYTDMRPLFTSREGDERSDLFSAAILKKRINILTKANFEDASDSTNVANEVVEFVKNMNDHLTKVVGEANLDAPLSKKIFEQYKNSTPSSKALYEIVFNISDGTNVTNIADAIMAGGLNTATNKFVYNSSAGSAADKLKEVKENLLKSGKTAGANAIADAIIAALAGEAAATAATTEPKVFPFKLGKYFMKSSADVFVDDKLSEIFAEEAAAAEQKWVRSGANIVSAANPSVVAGQNVEAECAGTKVKDGADSLKCTNYVKDCLMGNNINECKAYFASADFYDNTQEEVQNMDPIVAVRVLKQFGFKEESEYHEGAKMNIVSIQSVPSWVEGLKDVTSDVDTINNINSNDKLRQYLVWIVELVNSNPGILNPGYQNITPDDVPRSFGHTGFHKMGIKARRPVRSSCYRDIDAIANAIDQYNITLGIRLNAPIIGGIIPVRGMIGGGSMVDLSHAERSVEQLRTARKQTSELLHKTFNYLTSKLKVHNKDISQKDHQKIVELINDLAKKEQKLYEIIDFVEKYALLVDIFGERRVSEVVKVDDMKRAVDARAKLFAKKVKREGDVISVLKSLTGAVENETAPEARPAGTAAGI